MCKEKDSGIIVHWLGLNLSRRFLERIYGVSTMPETYGGWKVLAERLDSQQRRFNAIVVERDPQPTVTLVRPVTTFARPAAPLLHPLDMAMGWGWAPAAERCCFRCHQTGHAVHFCPLPDMRPQVPRARTCGVPGTPRTTEDYQREIALLQAKLEPLERERRTLAGEKSCSSPLSVPVPAASIPKYTILQQRHTRIGAEVKEEVRLAERPTKVQPKVEKHVPRELSIQVHLEALSTGKGAMTKALVDSGCTMWMGHRTERVKSGLESSCR